MCAVYLRYNIEECVCVCVCVCVCMVALCVCVCVDWRYNVQEKCQLERVLDIARHCVCVLCT